VKEVFPLKNFTTGVDSGLENKGYLHTDSDNDFIKKPDPDKG